MFDVRCPFWGLYSGPEVRNGAPLHVLYGGDPHKPPTTWGPLRQVRHGETTGGRPSIRSVMKKNERRGQVLLIEGEDLRESRWNPYTRFYYSTYVLYSICCLVGNVYYLSLYMLKADWSSFHPPAYASPKYVEWSRDAFTSSLTFRSRLPLSLVFRCGFLDESKPALLGSTQQTRRLKSLY